MKAKRWISLLLAVSMMLGVLAMPASAAVENAFVTFASPESAAQYVGIDHVSFIIDGADTGQDTTTGHWEIAGLISKKPMPTFPNGFPQEFLEAFSKAVGRKVLCNRPYSGTQVIQDYGDEHMQSGALIVYTSADSVFQIASLKSRST